MKSKIVLKQSIATYIILLAMGMVLGCKSDGSGAEGNIASSYDGYEKTNSGLFIKDITEGQGIEVQQGDIISIAEKLTYMDGTLLFTTDQIGGSVKFTVGADQVIAGIDEGVRGMKLGGQRSLIIPPSLSKRTEYPDNIHPDSILLSTITVKLINRP